MTFDLFEKRKQDILSKQDKSSKKHFDKKILKLCQKVNNLKNHYTTSSCAGRILIIIDNNKKEHNLFLWVSHSLISFRELRKVLSEITSPTTTKPRPPAPHSLLINSKKISNALIKFKSEPCILHVACRNLKDAQALLDKAKLAGWKKSGIIASEKRFVCELVGTEKLEFFIMNKGKILVDDDYLKLVVKKSNENLKKSWFKIKKLENLLRSI